MLPDSSTHLIIAIARVYTRGGSS